MTAHILFILAGAILLVVISALITYDFNIGGAFVMAILGGILGWAIWLGTCLIGLYMPHHTVETKTYEAIPIENVYIDTHSQIIYKDEEGEICSIGFDDARKVIVNESVEKPYVVEYFTRPEDKFFDWVIGDFVDYDITYREIYLSNIE